MSLSVNGLLALLAITARGAGALAPGAAAPELALQDQQGRHHRLMDYRGRWLLLYFYPKDDTPGCTKEACAFRDALAGLAGRNAAVLGVSLDSAASHARFAEKYRLGFALLCDPQGAVARAYGALLRFGPFRIARRRSFLIDPGGRIARVYRRVDPAGHSAQVLADLAALQGHDPR